MRAVDLIVLAGLYEELSALAQEIQNRAAATVDVWMLARALPNLLRLARYHSLRLEDAATLEKGQRYPTPKTSGRPGPPPAKTSTGRRHNSASTYLKALQPYIGMLEDQTLRDLWERALDQLAHTARAHPLLRGFAHRTLLDAELLPKESSATLLREALAQGTAIDATGHYVEGFLYSSAQVLIHQPEILSAVSVWLETISLSKFRQLLPVLRRTMSQFSKSERRKLTAVLVPLLETRDAQAIMLLQADAPVAETLASESETTDRSPWTEWISSWLGEPVA